MVVVNINLIDTLWHFIDILVTFVGYKLPSIISTL